MRATFASVKRTLAIGVVTAVVVVAGFLLSGGASVAVTVGVVGAMLIARVSAAWAAHEGLKAESLADQRKWTQRLEAALIPMGALSGLAPSALPFDGGGVSPEWFGLMVCSVAVVAANVLIGHGRTRTFLALTVPVVLGAMVSAALAGGELAIFFTPGGLVVGAILVLDNHEAGAIFRHARRLEEENRTLVSELQGSNSRLHHRVHTDPLTGLHNRAGLRLHLASLEASAADIFYIDLDGFKAINDTFGHAAGDAILASVGERLRGLVRSADCAARLGGDEFAVVIAADRPDATSMLERLRQLFYTPFAVGDLDLEIGASIGSQRAEPGDDLARAMRLADADMYDRKRARHRVLDAASD